MPNRVNLEKVSCISCPLCCEIKPKASLHVSFCQNYCFGTWPEGNSYFEQGIVEGVIKKTHSYLYTGCIFVDFSISYLRTFIERKWFEYLQDTKLNIILVCDKHLQPLANHWFKNEKNIFMTINCNDDLDCIAESIKKRFIGQRAMMVKGYSLSVLELNVLRALFAGQDCTHVAKMFDVDTRSVYAAKQRVEKKMGANINDLFRFSLTV